MICINELRRLAIPNVWHLSSQICICAHWVHDRNILSSSCVFCELFESITASSANCSQEFSNWEFFGPQIYPRFLYSGFFSVIMRVLKHRLKKRGEAGSPCRTPFVMGRKFVQLLSYVIAVDEFWYMLLKRSINRSGTWWNFKDALMSWWLTSPNALRRSRRVMISPLLFVFASRMMWESCSVCSVIPSHFGQKP